MIVDDYLVGIEYRFFVLQDETLAVLLHLAANFIGDGKNTFRQLVEIKNSYSLLGYS